MKTWCTRLLTAAFLGLLGGLALVLVAGDQKAAATTHAPGEDCWFDQSCDSLPGVVLAGRLLHAGWVVVLVAAVLMVVTASAQARGRPRPSPESRRPGPRRP